MNDEELVEKIIHEVSQYYICLYGTLSWREHDVMIADFIMLLYDYLVDDEIIKEYVFKEVDTLRFIVELNTSFLDERKSST